MARSYNPVGWQDGTVLQPAKVTIQGVEYNVDPQVSSGTTPINATNLRHMDNEIERIIEEDIPGVMNVELIAVTDTEPVSFVEGDKYYNTEDNKVYTAVDNEGTIEWDSGEEPIEGITYIVFDTQSAFAYDGTSLVGVGGGSGDLITVGTDIPTENTKLQIESMDLDFQGLEIANEYTTGDNVTYSTEYCNNAFGGTILWTNSSPSSSFAGQQIALSDNISNYDFYEVICNRGTDGTASFSTGKIPSSKLTRLQMTNNKFYNKSITALSGTSMTFDDTNVYTTYGSGTTTIDNASIIPLYVIGYKTGLFS